MKFSALHCQPLLILTALCLLLREQYPFSNFPMYSSFTNRTFYVYLADAEGAPLATEKTSGLNAPTLKKIFVSEMHQEHARTLTNEQKRAAGLRLLRRIKDSQPARVSNGLRLYEVDISMLGGRFEKQTSLIAELP